MSRNELALRERLNETLQATRVLRDDELDAVNGGLNLENCMISGFAAIAIQDTIVTSVVHAKA
jgi:hypothetical protein